jgi:hypothetical protein
MLPGTSHESGIPDLSAPPGLEPCFQLTPVEARDVTCEPDAGQPIRTWSAALRARAPRGLELPRFR